MSGVSALFPPELQAHRENANKKQSKSDKIRFINSLPSFCFYNSQGRLAVKPTVLVGGCSISVNSFR